MKEIVLLGVGLLVLAGCQTRILSEEPPPRTLATGVKVYVDNGSCPTGQVLEVTGSSPGVPRQKQCVPNPNA